MRDGVERVWAFTTDDTYHLELNWTELNWTQRIVTHPRRPRLLLVVQPILFTVVALGCQNKDLLMLRPSARCNNDTRHVQFTPACTVVCIWLQASEDYSFLSGTNITLLLLLSWLLLLQLPPLLLIMMMINSILFRTILPSMRWLQKHGQGGGGGGGGGGWVWWRSGQNVQNGISSEFSLLVRNYKKKILRRNQTAKIKYILQEQTHTHTCQVLNAIA